MAVAEVADRSYREWRREALEALRAGVATPRQLARVIAYLNYMRGSIILSARRRGVLESPHTQARLEKLDAALHALAKSAKT